MNAQLQEFARNWLKEGLSQLPADRQDNFKLMYARNHGKRSVEDSLAMEINTVVDEMEPEKLDWAMQQIQNSIVKQYMITEIANCAINSNANSPPRRIMMNNAELLARLDMQAVIEADLSPDDMLCKDAAAAIRAQAAQLEEAVRRLEIESRRADVEADLRRKWGSDLVKEHNALTLAEIKLTTVERETIERCAKVCEEFPDTLESIGKPGSGIFRPKSRTAERLRSLASEAAAAQEPPVRD